MNVRRYLVVISLLACSACMPFRHATHPAPGGADAARHVVDHDPAAASASAAGRFNAQVTALADQLERNCDRRSLGNTFIVTSFSNLDNLTETSPLGRLLAECLIHELQVRKWQVFDVRLTKDIIVNPSGEFSLSRDIDKIREQYKLGGVVAGTYTNIEGNVVVNGRAIDIKSGIVVSSGQARLNGNWFTDALLLAPDNQRAMRIVGNDD